MLLDIEMPQMNGFQVLEACLNDVNLRQIPIIMTSAMEELDAVVKCVELGAEDYLTKPVNPILLRARVNASLEKKRLRDEQRNYSGPLPQKKWQRNYCVQAFLWAANILQAP